MVMAIKRKICYAHKQHNGEREREKACPRQFEMDVELGKLHVENNRKYLNYFLSDMSFGFIRMKNWSMIRNGGGKWWKFTRVQNGVFATWVSEGVLMTLYAAAAAVLAMSSTYSMINDFISRFSSLDMSKNYYFIFTQKRRKK